MRLDEGWNRHAQDWITWARKPGHDSYWTFHRDAFLPLVPKPGRLTLDIGCGEGRVTRDLRALGHRVAGVDRSFAMAAAAADGVVVADATRLPFASDSADCAVAFMALHDIDQLAPAVREVSRILVPGGHFVIAIVHPLNTAGTFGEGTDPARPYVITGSYYEPRTLVDTVERDGLRMTFHNAHRPLQTYTEALTDAGFAITRLREPTSPEPDSAWHRMPLFLNIVAQLVNP